MVLSHREEDYILKKVRQDAYRKCDDVVRGFIDCTRDRYFSIPVKCNAQYLEMNECLKIYNNDEVRYEETLKFESSRKGDLK